MKNILLQLYRLMLRLYPSRFYNTFGAEMADVFAARLHDAADNRALLAAFGRELRYWPGTMLREHWAAQQTAFHFPSYETLSWPGTVAAALPYLLMALIFADFALSATQLALGNVLLSMALVALAVAWWQRWPAWSASWLGFLAFQIFYLLLPQYIGLAYNEWSSEARMLLTIISYLLVLLPLFCVHYWLVGRWPRAGIVVLLLPIGLSSRFFMEIVPGYIMTRTSILAWIWVAVAVVLLARWGNGRWQVWLLSLAATVVSLGTTWAGQVWRQSPSLDVGSFQAEIAVGVGMGQLAMSDAISLPQLVENFLHNFVPTLLPLVAVLLLHALRWSGVMENGRGALQSYRLLFWGVLGVLAIGQVASVLFFPNALAAFQIGQGTITTAVFLMSLLSLGIGAWRLRRSRPGWLLLMLAVSFPFIYHIETSGALIGELPFINFSNDVMFYETVQLGGHALGLLWLVLSAWQLGRTAPLLLREPEENVTPMPPG